MFHFSLIQEGAGACVRCNKVGLQLTKQRWCRPCRSAYDRARWASNKDEITRRRKLAKQAPTLESVTEQLNKTMEMLAALQAQAVASAGVNTTSPELT